eukprot:10016844-Ditylum_brightwellii.AAC.1
MLSLANVLNDTLLQCKSPPSSYIGPVHFKLLLKTILSTPPQEIWNEFNDTAFKAIFTYVAAPRIASLTPSSAIAAGETALELHGYFGKEKPMIRFISRTNPSLITYGVTEYHSSSRVLVRLPQSPDGNMGGTVTVEASNNGQDFPSEGMSFTYTESMWVKGFDPRIVPEYSGVSLVIFGENFGDNHADLLRCKVGEDVMTAFWVGPNVSSCHIPNHLPVGNYSVSLSMNKKDFSLAPHQLHVRPSITVVGAFPMYGPSFG